MRANTAEPPPIASSLILPEQPSLAVRARRGLGWLSGWGLVYVLMLGWAAISIAGFGWIAMTSLKTNQELFADVWGLPTLLHWENYVNAWRQSNMQWYFVNSLMVSAASVLGAGLVGAMASYVLARFKFWSNRLLLILFIAGIAVPHQLILVPIYLMLNQLKLLNSLGALVALYIAVTLPFTIFFLVGFFRSLPRELDEAAVLDGASDYGVFWHIMFPLARPGLITAGIFNFLFVWNEYVFSLFLLSDSSKMTVPVGLYNLRATQGYRGDWVSMFAGLVMVLLPTLIVFLLLQRRIEGGMTVGALKG